MNYEEPVLIPDHDVEIDDRNLWDEFRYFSAIYYRYGLQKTGYEDQLSTTNLAIKNIKAAIYKEGKERKCTDKMIEALYQEDTAIQFCFDEVLKLESQIRKIDVVLISLKHKKDCLIQMGADARKD